MKTQNGAALLVVLSLLTISLMVGLSSMQSSQLDERLAGNYKSQTEAQMNAELGLSRFYSWLLENPEWPGVGIHEDWKEDNDLVNDGRFSLLIDSLSDDVIDGLSYNGVEWYMDPVHGGSVRLVSKGEQSATGAVSNIYAVFSYGGGDSLLDLVYAAFTCYGANCSVSPGSGKASNSFNGYDHEVDLDVGCSIKGSNVPDVDEGGAHSSGVFMVDGTLDSGSEDNIDGIPPTVTDFDAAREYLGLEEDATHAEITNALSGREDEFLERFEALLGNAKTSGSGEVSGMDVFHYAGPGEKISLDGNAGGVIILEGGTLEMKGNSCFAGVVLAKESVFESQIIVPEFDTRGTAAIVGGVVGRAIDFSGKGTPSVYYSSLSITGIADPGVGISGPDEIRISEWSGL